MKTPNSIFVVIDNQDIPHIALERALQFALVNDVHIMLFSVVYEPIEELEGSLSTKHKNEIKDSCLHDCNQQLEKIARELDKKGIQCSVKVAWHREIEKAIEEAVVVSKPDLVIKKISANPKSINPFAMPIDRHLLRYCSASLLLIQQSQWRTGPITLAIDPSAYDKDHLELNSRIIEYGKLLQALTKNDLNIVSTFHLPTISPSITMYGVDYDIMHADSFQIMRDKLFNMLRQDNISMAQIHVVEGNSDHAIPRFIVDTQSGLLVLGTVGRTGISAFFLGNMAEKILAEVNCEILALKPLESLNSHDLHR